MSNKLMNSLNISSIVFLCIFILLSMSLVYAVSSSTLTVDGSAYVRSNDDIRITNIELNNSTNGGYLNENLEFSNHTFNVNGHIPSALGANGNLIVDVTITNLSSSNVLITSVRSINFSNTNMTYTLENITPNETVIPAASDYTFQVKIQFKEGVVSTILKFTETLLETLFGISTNINGTFQVAWSRVSQHSITINTTPPDALIIIKQGDTILEVSENGTCTALLDDDATINWTVSKDGYQTQTGTETITDNITRNIVLVPAETHTLTIVPVPSDANVIIKRGDIILASGTGTQSINVSDQNPVQYEVSKEDYNTQTGTVQTEGENKNITITLVEAEYFEGTYTNTMVSTAEVINESIYHTGYYLVELWGGHGGYGANNETGNGIGGDAGYVNGIIHIENGQKLYITLGGYGATETSTSNSVSGGANGGGSSAAGGGGGGGYSSVGININSVSLNDVTNNSVLLIAGGGGGGGAKIGRLGTSGNGGNGGNITSSSTTSYENGMIYNGFDGTTSKHNTDYPATGGTNVGGTCNDITNTAGSLFSGGTGYRNGGGGGSGFYGGAGGASRDSLFISVGGGSGGAGGSSYINTNVLPVSSNYQSELTNTNPSSSGGAVIIKYLGKEIN